MEKCYYGLDYKAYCIYEPLDENGDYTLYCVHKDMIEKLIDEILDRHGIDVYYIDYNMGITNRVCEIKVNPGTSEQQINRALKEIVDTISCKKYTTLGDEVNE